MFCSFCSFCLFCCVLYSSVMVLVVFISYEILLRLFLRYYNNYSALTILTKECPHLSSVVTWEMTANCCMCVQSFQGKKETGCCVWYSPRLPGYTIPISFTGRMYCLYNTHRTWLGTRETWPYDQWIPLSSVFCGYVVLDKWHLYTCTQLLCPHQQVQV